MPFLQCKSFSRILDRASQSQRLKRPHSAPRAQKPDEIQDDIVGDAALIPEDLELEQDTDILPPAINPTGRIWRPQILPSKFVGFEISSRAAMKKSRKAVDPRPPSPEPLSPNSEMTPSQSSSQDDAKIDQRFVYITEPNSFGLFRVYEGSIPSINPDLDITSPLHGFGSSAAAVLDPPISDEPDPSHSDTETTAVTSIAPFLNKSAFLLMNWFYKQSKHSLKRLDKLVKGVLLHPDFQLDDLKGWNTKNEVKRMDDYVAGSGKKDGPSSPFSAVDGWSNKSMTLKQCSATLVGVSQDFCPFCLIFLVSKHIYYAAFHISTRSIFRLTW
ncbi:hypothetical protein C8J56DRAFT_1115559 [Mycena floridula]|nr:hypothetical protein C8J56DRAFT_1115559 [Mycena floridula]